MHNSQTKKHLNLKATLGFTLLETLIAMIIMSGGILLVANAWSGNFQRIEKSKINHRIAYLLQKKMIEVEIKYKESNLEEIPDDDAGDFKTESKEFNQYRWQMKAREFEMPNLGDLMSSKDGGANQTVVFLMKQMTEFLRKAVKEVTVTIIYRSRISQREIRNSASLYFIDYKKDLPMADIPGLNSKGSGANPLAPSTTGATGGTN